MGLQWRLVWERDGSVMSDGSVVLYQRLRRVIHIIEALLLKEISPFIFFVCACVPCFETNYVISKEYWSSKYFCVAFLL